MLRSVRILVVEDERSLAAALQRGLRAEGFAVDTSEDGHAGLALARVAGLLPAMFARAGEVAGALRIAAAAVAALEDPAQLEIVARARLPVGERVAADDLDAGAAAHPPTARVTPA